MFINYRCFNLCSFVFIITILSSTALFCSDLTSVDDKDTPCFLEPATVKPVSLRISSNSLVLPCHVARSRRATVEWWYSDPQKIVNTKIYPVYPAVRPSVVRFITNVTPNSKNSNETDILDTSILLRHINVDDSGIYRCVIRPWTMDPIEQMENILFIDDSKISKLNYDVQLTAPRLCEMSPGILPCFMGMRTSSPTVIDAYQTAFLPCVVESQKRPVDVFWVVGDSSANSILITSFLNTNQYNGDRLRRAFTMSSEDFSIELSFNRSMAQRVYSCVVTGATDAETTLFTYIIRNMDIEKSNEHTLDETTRHHEKTGKHNTLLEQILSLRGDSHVEKDDEDLIKEELSEADREDEKEMLTKAV